MINTDIKEKHANNLHHNDETTKIHWEISILNELSHVNLFECRICISS